MMEKCCDFIEQNLKEIREKIRRAAIASGRTEADIMLTAVTKTVSPENINSSIRLGVSSIGENKVQEFLSKKDEYHLQNVSVNFIGNLQKNKVKYICDKVDCIESVNSYQLGCEIQKQCAKIDRVMPILLEVNIGEEKSKSGIAPYELEEVIRELSQLKNIHIIGLMTIPPIGADPTEKRMYCRDMNKIFVDIKQKKIDNVFMHRLSMGMSADFEEAILEGATEVRIGSALFGSRNINH